MEIKTINFLGKDGDKMVAVYLLSDEGEELERFTFYNAPSESKIEPELQSTLNRLPSFLKRLYNSGINNESIEFTETDIDV